MGIRQLLEKFTTDEKIALLSGKDFWHTQDYPRYGIPSIEVADVPCGLRKQEEQFDHLGFHQSKPAAAYPSGPALTASWEMIENVLSACNQKAVSTFSEMRRVHA